MHLLADCLSVSVPLYIQRIKNAGGMHGENWEFYQRVLREYADRNLNDPERDAILLFGSSKKGEATKVFNEFAQAIAIMAFVPGGVRLFGMHFDASFGPPYADFSELQIKQSTAVPVEE